MNDQLQTLREASLGEASAGEASSGEASSGETARHNTLAAATIFRALVLSGVRDVVLSPGSRNTPLVLAAHAHPQILLHPVLDERAAGFLALGLARAKGAPVVLCCTSGSAAAHYLPALIEAGRSGVPLLVLGADRPPELQRSGAPQTIEQAGLFGVHVKLSRTLPTPGAGLSLRALGAAVIEAAGRAMATPAGAIHLNVPFREPLWSPEHPVCFERSELPRLFAPAVSPQQHLSSERLHTLALLLRETSRGVIYCGPNAADTPAFAPLIAELARVLGWPLLAEVSSGVRFSTGEAEDSASSTNPLISCHEALLRSSDFAATHSPEVFFQIGQAPHSRALHRWLAEAAPQRRVFLTPDGARQDPHHQATDLIWADPSRVIAGLIDALRILPPQTGRGAWFSSWSAAETCARATLRGACREGFWEGTIAHDLVDTLPSGALLHSANSMPFRDLDAFAFDGPEQLQVFVSRGANGIDGTFATALGEALAKAQIAGEKGEEAPPMLLLIGDMAFLHDLGGLHLLSQHHVNLSVVVINNGGGGIFEFLPIAKHPDAFERCFITPQDADLGAISRGFGIPHQQVSDRVALIGAVQESLKTSGPCIIEALVDRADNVARHGRAWESVALALKEQSTHD